MKIKPEELLENNYTLIDEMNHNELMPFVKKFLHKKTGFSIFYYLSVFTLFVMLLFFSAKFYKLDHLSLSKIMSAFSSGIVITFILIPLHELIHAAAYKLQGAKKTSFDVNLKKFYFLAIADKFVANKREFVIVAFAPFILISLALIIALFFSGEYRAISILATLLIHTTCCSGDFALLSYFEFNKSKEIVTYDDKENKISFFYEKCK